MVAAARRRRRLSSDPSPVASVATALRFTALTLETGVTTVRDLGATNFTDIAMRDSIAIGAMIGPRLFMPDHGLGKLTTAPVAGAPSTVPRGRVRDTPLFIASSLLRQLS
jgi:hypothetical protein